MKIGALDHPKTLDLAARLGVELPTAIGYLELLWAFTAKQSPQGNIGKWPDGAIARACYWMASPAAFVLVLQQVGFLEANATHRLIVHDWHEHVPRWVKAKLAADKLGFVTLKSKSTASPVVEPIGNPIDKTEKPVDEGKDTAVQSVDDTTDETIGAPSKRSQAKGFQAKGYAGLRARASETEPDPGGGEPGPSQETNGNLPHGELAPLTEAERMAQWQQWREAYPGGTYPDSKFLLAEREYWRVRESGASASELLLAAIGYREQQQAEGNCGTRFIKHPDAFLQTGAWRGKDGIFPITPTRAETRLAGNIAVLGDFVSGGKS